MTSINELCCSSHHENRGTLFIFDIAALGQQIKRKYAYSDLFDLTVEDALHGWMERYNALQKFITGNEDLAVFTPAILADKLDRRSASSCLVEVYVCSTSRQPIREFLEMALVLAGKHEGTIDRNFLALLLTADKENLITTTSDEFSGESRHITHIFFDFNNEFRYRRN